MVTKSKKSEEGFVGKFGFGFDCDWDHSDDNWIGRKKERRRWCHSPEWRLPARRKNQSMCKKAFRGNLRGKASSFWNSTKRLFLPCEMIYLNENAFADWTFSFSAKILFTKQKCNDSLNAYACDTCLRYLSEILNLMPIYLYSLFNT